MTIQPAGPSIQVAPTAQSALQKPDQSAQAQSAAPKDTANISQKAKDLAAQLNGKTQQEEAKESPVVEANEEQGKK